jgi:hypothetical protein
LFSYTAASLRYSLDRYADHTVKPPKGGQFVLHARALHGNPFDGHTLDPAIVDIERMTGIEVKRGHVDKSLPRT